MTKLNKQPMTIRLKRGLETSLPTLAEGEPAFTTDTKLVYVGTDSGNIEVGGIGSIFQGGNAFSTPLSIGTNDNQKLEIKTNDTARMTITEGGNVGIGTTPAYKLDVAGDINFTGDIRPSGTPGITSSFTILDGDGSTTHNFIFTKGLLTSYTTS